MEGEPGLVVPALSFLDHDVQSELVANGNAWKVRSHHGFAHRLRCLPYPPDIDTVQAGTEPTTRPIPPHHPALAVAGHGYVTPIFCNVSRMS